jgi:hypothetical protein
MAEAMVVEHNQVEGNMLGGLLFAQTSHAHWVEPISKLPMGVNRL